MYLFSLIDSSQILPELILPDPIFFQSLLSLKNPSPIWIPGDNEVGEGKCKDSTDLGSHLNLNMENIFAPQLNKNYPCYKNFTLENSKFLSAITLRETMF